MTKHFFLYFVIILSIALVDSNEARCQGLSRGPFAAYMNEEYNGEYCEAEDLNGELTYIVDLWYQEMENNLFEGDYVLNYIRPKRYVDLSLRNWGMNYEYLDSNNIALIAGHGGYGHDSNNIYYAYYKLDRTRPDYPTNCTIWPAFDMKLGNLSDDVGGL